MRCATWLLVLFVAAITAAPGCGLRGSRTAFFALDATAAPGGGPPPGSWDVAVGLGPVTIPSYLDRPQLVRRVGANELHLADGARWAEPLREGIGRALQQDLLVASSARRVALYPWASAAAVDLVVAVDVVRFEVGPEARADLVARWSVRDAAHGRVLAVRESRVTEPVAGHGTDAEVAALSRTLGGLAHEIALTLRGAG